MLRKMGMSGAGGGMSKAGMAAMQNQMNRNMASARQRERMQAKLAARQAKKEEVEEKAGSRRRLSSLRRKAERTPRVPGHQPAVFYGTG